MDTLTQGLLGAVAVEAALGRRLGPRAWVAGAVSGMLADADVVLRPLADPAFPVEMHRHLTHAFAFVPVGAALATVLLLPFRAFRARWPLVLLACLVGYLTHPLLDLCTSYGTLVLWPFSEARPAWDVVSVVDPVYTLVLAVGLVLAVRGARPRLALVALALSTAYLGLGWVQHARALDAQQALAAARGDQVEHARVMPTLGNLVVWRSVYVASGRLHQDDLRLPPFGGPEVRPGASVPRFLPEDVPAGGPEAARRREVFARFWHFADGLTARVPDRPEVVGDMRYALDGAFGAIWGMRIAADEPPAWRSMFGDRRRALGDLASAVFSGDTFVPLATVTGGR